MGDDGGYDASSFTQDFIISNNYLDGGNEPQDDGNEEMRVEDADDEEFESIIRDKRQSSKRENQSFKGSFLINNNLKDSRVSTSSNKQQDFVVKSTHENQFDILQQLEDKEEKLETNDVDYMDRFFEEKLKNNRQRNRRTSPVNYKSGKDQKRISHAIQEQIQHDLEKHMLDGDFSINSIKKNADKKRMTVHMGREDMQKRMDKLFAHDEEDQKQQDCISEKKSDNDYKGFKEADQSSSSGSDLDLKKVEIKKQEVDLEPDVLSLNEDNLDEQDDPNQYLDDIIKKHREAIEAKDGGGNSFLESALDSQDPQLLQMRELRDSIVKSVTNILTTNTEDTEQLEDEKKKITDEVLRIKYNDDYSKDFYLGMHQDVLMREMSPKSKKRTEIIQRLTKDEWDYKDIIKIIDWNERRHREVAQEHIKQNSVISLQNVSTKDIKIRILSQFQTMNSLSNKMLKEQKFSQSQATCIALTDSLVLIGNSEGQLWMFDRDTEEEYSNFSEKSKDFLGNAVVSMDVHPLRPEYVILGYERGQLVLIDIQEPKKSVKVIKDHHKVPIMNVKFCDWQGDSGIFSGKKDEAALEDKQAWMFISIDQQGRVLINTITKVLFVLKASKHTIIDPSKYDGVIYASLACRFQQAQYLLSCFRSNYHGKHPLDDVSIIALGNAEHVQIIEAKQSKHQELVTYMRPMKFFNKKIQEFTKIQAKVPSLSWGYGQSPAIQDRPHSILAIAWGPLIQLIVLFDNEGANQHQPFITDGYYIIRNFGLDAISNVKHPGSFSRRGTMSRMSDLQNQSIQAAAGSQSNPLRMQKQKSDLFEFEDESATKETENFEQAFQSIEELQQHDSDAFLEPSLDIEQIQFFSDSTLLIVTKVQEIRILNISAFIPNTYDPDEEKVKFERELKRKRRVTKKSNKLEELTQSVELEYGLRISSQLQQSEYGCLYHQTIKFFKGKIVALTIKNVQQCQHLTWQQSIYEFKKVVEDDLVQVFSRALDIYKGNVKGYSGLPDSIVLREKKLKDEIKLLVREIIQQVISKTRQGASMLRRETGSVQKNKSNINEQQATLIQSLQDQDFKDEKAIKYQTLIRIAIEFCVELKDQKFLFYDLFILFKEEKLEDAFIHELEPFIMAGKFQEWELPNEVIQNHVLKYYKDSQKAEALERIIVNLNLAQCPKTIVLEFIHYSEQNFLTTAILYLYSQVFEKKDNTSCVQILFSLFDLYKKAGKKNQGLLIDIQNLKEFPYNSKEKEKVEKSQVYLGYKILWVIRMFLNGLKFPYGTIKTSSWRTYIHDIIELLQSHDILKVLLEIDADAFFQTISILFYPSKPCELYDQGRDEPNEADLNQQQQVYLAQKVSNHALLVKSLDQCCMNILTKDSIKHQYIFYAASVIAKSYIRGLDNLYYYNLAREVLQQYKRYLEYNKKLQTTFDQKNAGVNEKLNKYRKFKMIYQDLPEFRYIVKAEGDIMNLIEKSEPMDNFQIMELSKLAEPTQFNQVKVLLMEKREDYLKCLMMFINEFKINQIWTFEVQSRKVIRWVREKIIFLQDKASQSQYDKNVYEQFKREVQQNIGKILPMNPTETIELVDEFYEQQHKEMVDFLYREPELQLKYLDTLLRIKEHAIEKTIKNHGLQSNNTKDAKKYIELLKLHLRLCCQFQQAKVLQIVQKMIKNSYYPIEDCLEICQEYSQLDSTFLLNRKVGKYYECVEQGLQILRNKIDYTKLKVEMFFAYTHDIDITFQIHNTLLEQATQFDNQLRQIVKICKKHYKEVEHEKEEQIWFIVIDIFIELLSLESLKNKFYVKSFLRDRFSVFSEALIRSIPFQSFLNHMLKHNRRLQFKDIGHIIIKQFSGTTSEQQVLRNSNNAIYKVNSELFQIFQQSRSRGILFRQRICIMCKRYMDSFMHGENSTDLVDQQYLLASRNEEEQEGDNPDTYSQPIKVFACKHTFHLACLERHFSRKKKNESEIAYQRRIEKLRCPTCNLKSYEIESNNGPRALRKTPKGGINPLENRFTFTNRKDSIIKKDRKVSQMSGASSEDAAGQGSDKTELWEKERLKRIAKEQSDKLRKLENMQKRMEYYEQVYDLDGLKIKDFKQFESMVQE